MGMKLLRIGAVTIVTLAMLWSGHSVYEKYVSEKPFHEAVINLLPNAVVEHKKEGSKVIVNVESDKIDDLGKQYRDIYKMSKEHLGSEVELNFLDHPDEDLTDLWKVIQFPLYQGLATGKYMDMHNEINFIVSQTEMDYLVTLDEKHLYLQIAKNDKYLYRIISRERGGEAS
ncbi:hypothetical protein F9B85_00215 [Heliorestis acidaminivorans]|uniref:Uncharacterized protein n=1 Tax=Heliorestis acidaminivorans TaxID=553427 RepID=A0A6I0EUW8_9FIRM|nr:hypothetical protein [Heliorestis acidaminivorans]KAB2954164.1 hypothetical protein F9B85_00215 [Heliorestis acidaminivorans]